MQRPRYALAALAVLVGCVVEPPVPLEEDSRYAAVALPPGRAVRLRLTVAPPTGRDLARATPRWRAWTPPALRGAEEAAVADEAEWLVPPDEATAGDSPSDPTEELDPLADSGLQGSPAQHDEGLASRAQLRIDGADAPPDSEASPSAPEASPPDFVNRSLARADPLPSKRLVDREYSWRPPPPDAAELQRRLARVLSWALVGGEPVGQIGVDWLRGDPERGLRLGAEAQGADLLVHVELLEHQVAWVERDGLWWWSNLLLFYGPGIYPVVLIPDEVYEASLEVRISVVHPRSGVSLLTKDLAVTHRQSLNDAQRGWSISGLLFLYPWTLDASDYQTVWDALLPHALKGLELGVASWLREVLPAKLAEPAVRELIELGDPAQARTYAVVVGSAGPETDDVDRPPPLRRAEADARAMRALLLETQTVASSRDLRLLVGPRATPERLLAAVTDLGSRMLGNDRLVIYYSGYGRTSKAGPSLVFSGNSLSLRRLSERCATRLHPRSPVVFLLDTSFGGEGGKTYPGGEARGEPKAYLSPLWARHPRWKVLTASGSGQVALTLRDEPYSLFTSWLLSGIRNGADSDEDREVSTLELSAFLRPQVSGDAERRANQRQTPALLGTGPEFVVFHTPPAKGAESEAEEPWGFKSPQPEALPLEETGAQPDRADAPLEREQPRRLRLR